MSHIRIFKYQCCRVWLQRLGIYHVNFKKYLREDVNIPHSRITKACREMLVCIF